MQIIVSLRLFEIESTRAGVTPRIITPLKLYPGRFWDLPESTPYKMCDPPRIHPSLPQHTAPFQQLYATLRESTPPSQNIPPPLLTNYMCDTPRIPQSTRV